MRKLLFIVIILNSICFYSQKYDRIIKYDYNFGLPTEQVYNVVPTKDGYYWICTDNGLIRYNGSSFIQFNTTNGLPSNDIVDIFEDSKNRKWIKGFFNGIYYIVNNKVYNIKTPLNVPPFKEIYEFDNKIFFITSTQVYELNEITNKFSKIYQEKNRRYINVDFANNVAFISKNRIFNLLSKTISPNKDTIIKITKYQFEKNLIFKKNDLFYFLKNNKYYDIKKLTKFDITKIKILSRQNSKYQIIYDDKIYVYKNNIYISSISDILNSLNYKKSFLNQIVIDKYENIWIGFENSTYIYIPSGFENIKNYYLSDLNKNTSITAASLYKNYLYFSTPISIHNFNVKDEKFTDTNDSLQNYTIGIKTNKNLMYMNFKNGLQINKIRRNGKLEFLKIYDLGYRNIDIVNDTLYGLQYDNIQYAINKLLLKRHYTNFRLKLIDHFEKTLYFGNEKDLFTYNLDNKKIIHLQFDNTNTFLATKLGLILGTNSNKLLLFDNNLKIKCSYTIKDNCINAIQYDEKKKLILVGTNYCIYVFKYENNKFIISNKITKENGLISGKIIKIEIYNNKTYVISQQGISIIKDLSPQKIEAEIDINYLLNNNQKTFYPFNKIAVERKLNSVSIETSIKGINYNPNNFDKFYTLNYENEDDNYKRFDFNTFNFSDLKPGNYTFKVYLKNKVNNKNLIVKKLNFVIKPYFWETIWFKIASILLLFITILLLFTYYKKKSIEKLNLKNDMIFMEMKALKSQMSPHFIFNIINSLQSSVLLEDEIKVNYLFNKFSTLMRSTLNIVNNESINLFSEIEYLKNYIELENYRRNNDVNVDYFIDEFSSLKNITIPVMLIQPIIENIFLHAFNSSIKYKKIEIHVFKKENYIHFVIEDNGTGFIAKPENKVHKSIALETIIKRIDILNKVNKTSHSINIYNLNETQGKTGTKVEFKFSF